MRGPAQGFLSAHYGEGWRVDSSAWYETFEFEYVGETGGRPIVWTGLNKHPNYESQAHCDEGNWHQDSCDGPVNNFEVSVLSTANLGFSYAPFLDCVPSRLGRAGTECFWSGSEFRGWSNLSSSATGYSSLLSNFHM